MPDKRILLVEDELTHRRLFERNLQRSEIDIDIVSVENGEKALAYLEAFATKPDAAILVVLDLKMPGMNGVQVLERMQQNSQLRDIPVIVLTTSDNSDEVKACQQLGAKEYLIKPVEFNDMLHHIENYLK